MGLGSEIQDQKKPFPGSGSGSRGQKGTRSRIRKAAKERALICILMASAFHHVALMAFAHMQHHFVF
jgi:hypothetical protein